MGSDFSDSLRIAKRILSARWADVMWPVVWQGAALALVVLGLTLALRRAPAAVRFWLWMLVPLRLVLMPAFTLGLPVLPARAEAPALAMPVAVHAAAVAVADVSAS